MKERAIGRRKEREIVNYFFFVFFFFFCFVFFCFFYIVFVCFCVCESEVGREGERVRG